MKLFAVSGGEPARPAGGVKIFNPVLIYSTGLFFE